MRIIHQVTLSILTALLLVVVIVGIAMYLSVEKGFKRYVRALEEARLRPAVGRLQDIYEREGSFESVVSQPQLFRFLLRREDHGRTVPPQRAPADTPRRSFDPLELPPRVTLYDAQGNKLRGRGTLSEDASKLPLRVSGQLVGWLGVRAIDRFDDELDIAYLEQVRGQILAIAALASALGLLTGWLLTRRILKPIAALSAGTRRLRAGDFTVRIGQERNETDELGRLSQDFDALAMTLAEDSRARRRWVADTSHELRTPMTTLRAELEALLDGIRPTDPAALGSLHAEVMRMEKLVSDLEELARADRGELSLTLVKTAPVPLVLEMVAAFRGRFERRSITVAVDLESVAPLKIQGDQQRLKQIFANLLENSARYTDPGGKVYIHAETQQFFLHLYFEDSAPGVPGEALTHLFERLFRVEPSRSREFGGAGLGLSICQRLVHAHGGEISARPSDLGGLCMELRFPLRDE